MRRTVIPEAHPTQPEPDRTQTGDRANLLILAVGVGLFLFLTIEPTQAWLLLLITGLALLGMGALARAEAVYRSEMSGEAPAELRVSDSVFSLIIPTLWVFGGGLLAEEIAGGFWSIPAAVVVAAGFGIIAHAELFSLHEESSWYQAARFALNVAAYVIAFALFATPYALELGRFAAAIFVGVAAVLMAIDLLREAPIPAVRVLLVAGAAGLLLAETRWSMYYLGIEEFSSATLLLVVFYVASGLLQSQLLAKLSAATALEYALVGGAGLLIIAAAELIG
ncbi:MAG TPA: hypothetical protein VNL92_00260 [Dehalococcoidia bacterium]|nr:hypothetical protein [Dehalococcoidia bacterium]